jgi:putative ABC transport system permease protein
LTTPAVRSVFFSASHVATQAEEQAAQGRLRSINAGLRLYVERGYQGRPPLGALALVVVATLIGVAATAIVTALLLVELSPTLLILAAVGASPRARRTIAILSSAAVSLVATAFGVGAGLLLGFAAVRSARGFPLLVQWRVVFGLAVLVPLLATTVARIAGPASSLPLERLRESWSRP